MTLANPAEPTQTSAPEYGVIDELPPVYVDARWESLTLEEFALRYANRPVVFRGIGNRIAAMKRWTDEFFLQFGDDDVRVAGEFPLSGGVHRWVTTLKLREFIRDVKTRRGLYLSEWYLFKRHPEILRDVLEGLPGYLLDDWFELIPERWAFGAEKRNNVYWGADGSRTIWHWDSWATVTWNVTLRGTKRWLLFSGRDFGMAGITRMVVRDELLREGVLDETGFVSVDGLKRHFATQSLAERELKFCWADVRAGDMIFVPPNWAHQVHNIGESLAASRYYINAVNFDTCADIIRSRGGRIAHGLFRALLGHPNGRQALRNPMLRRVLSSDRSVQAFRFLMRTAGIPPNDAMDLYEPASPGDG